MIAAQRLLFSSITALAVVGASWAADVKILSMSPMKDRFLNVRGTQLMNDGKLVATVAVGVMPIPEKNIEPSVDWRVQLIDLSKGTSEDFIPGEVWHSDSPDALFWLTGHSGRDNRRYIVVDGRFGHDMRIISANVDGTNSSDETIPSLTRGNLLDIDADGRVYVLSREVVSQVTKGSRMTALPADEAFITSQKVHLPQLRGHVGTMGNRLLVVDDAGMAGFLDLGLDRATAVISSASRLDADSFLVAVSTGTGSVRIGGDVRIYSSKGVLRNALGDLITQKVNGRVRSEGLILKDSSGLIPLGVSEGLIACRLLLLDSVAASHWYYGLIQVTQW